MLIPSCRILIFFGSLAQGAPDAEAFLMVPIQPNGNGGEREPGRAPGRRFQFRLATLFLLTTVFAVASAGFAKGSIEGAVGALFGAWTTLIGCACIWGGVRERTLLGLAIGAGYVILGASIWIISVF
jgi:hypothetical protein